MFELINDAICITYNNGIYTPRRVYSKGERLFIEAGKGFYGLHKNGFTGKGSIDELILPFKVEYTALGYATKPKKVKK